METRTLGDTGLELSLLGFGCSPLGDVFGKIDVKDGMRAVHMAIERGVNFFDVSPFYGFTLAEERVGAFLEGRRDQVLISTKCGRYGIEEFDFSAPRLEASIDESLARLGTDYVDLLHLHDIEFCDPRQVVEETEDHVRLLPNLLKPDKIESINKSSIEQRQIAEVSSMPAGLLDTFTVEEILDLLAFIQSLGDASK